MYTYTVYLILNCYCFFFLIDCIMFENSGFPDSSVGKESSAVQETEVWFLGRDCDLWEERDTKWTP